MSEESNEMLLLMKELVTRIKTLEETVYHKDNLLMKAGWVVSESPSPSISNSGISSDLPDSDTISKMDWSQIHEMVERMEGA